VNNFLGLLTCCLVLLPLS